MVSYKNKKTFLSTIHATKMEREPKRGRDDLAVSKLKLVNDYNKFMECVVRSDTLIGNYTRALKSFELAVKVAFHFIEGIVLNSFILFNKVKPGKSRFMNFK